jgi:hypothetical protein
MQRILGRLTYANVMATIAVFIALGGAGYAATRLPKNSVGTKQIKNGAVTGAKISLSTIGTVPSAKSADTAQNAASAGHAASADTAAAATNASHAGTADNATALGGLAPGAYAHAGALPMTNATLENGWTATVTFGTPGYAKDPFGIVHLYGAVYRPTDSYNRVFTLPPEDRPSYEIDIPAAIGAGAVGVLYVGTTGQVQPLSSATSFIDLEGVSFRAGG